MNPCTVFREETKNKKTTNKKQKVILKDMNIHQKSVKGLLKIKIIHFKKKKNNVLLYIQLLVTLHQQQIEMQWLIKIMLKLN